MQVPVIINSVGTMINADVNAKNWLTQEYVIKDLFRIRVILNVSVINYAILKSIETMKAVNVEKKLVKKLVEQCTETDDKMK